jgi:hypothetical protein
VRHPEPCPSDAVPPHYLPPVRAVQGRHGTSLGVFGHPRITHPKEAAQNYVIPLTLAHMEPSVSGDPRQIFITCPTTGTPGAVGITTEAEFANMSDDLRFGGCGACHDNHQWRKSDAYLEELPS